MPSDLIVSVSGIRGIVGAGLTPEATARFAAAFGSTVAGRTVVLSRDGRPSGEMLRHSVLAGLLGAGCTVEDIGIADPRALPLCIDAWQAYERLGTPEGELALATAVVYLACAPKSNAVYVAMGEAMEDVAEFGTLDVPLRLRNAPTRLMKNLGFGRGYRYAHDEPEAFAAGERYLPDELPDRRYYRPVPRGLEVKIGEALARLRSRAPAKG